MQSYKYHYDKQQEEMIVYYYNGERMWSEESYNTYNQVIRELDRLGGVFSHMVGLHEEYVAYYKANGDLPDDYRKRLDQVIIASPYDEVTDFLQIQKTYQGIQRTYFDYIYTVDDWDKNYLKKAEKEMSNLIQTYMDKLEEIAKQ